MQEQRAKPPLTSINLARELAAAHDQRHRAVVLEGRWLGAHTVYLDNRQMNGRVGFFALTPLLLDDGSAVLVQRGWLPRDAAERSRIVAAPAVTGRVRVQGHIALEPARLYEFDGAATGAIRQNVNVAGLAGETGLPLRPLTVVQDGDALQLASNLADAAVPAGDGLLREWPAPSSGVHKHYGYAFQWFSLSVLTMGLYLWFQILRPRWRAQTGPSGSQPGAARS